MRRMRIRSASSKDYTKLDFIVAKSIRRCGGESRFGTCMRDRNKGIAKDISGGATCLIGGSIRSTSSGGHGTGRLKVPVVSRSAFVRRFNKE